MINSYSALRKILLILVISFSAHTFAQETADAKYWIYFKDKGQFKEDVIIEKGSIAWEKRKDQLNERAVKRRMKVLGEDRLIDYKDLPVENSYVSGLRSGNQLVAKIKMALTE